MNSALVKFIGCFINDRDLIKILQGRRCGNPAIPGWCLPRDSCRWLLAMPGRLDQVDQDDHESGDHHQGTQGGDDVGTMELSQVVEISAWHPLDTQVEHGTVEGHKSNEEGDPAGSGPALVIHAAKDLRKPVVNGAKEGKAHYLQIQ